MKKRYKIEMYQDAKKEWRWRLKAPNGRIMASGEGYKKKKTMEKTLFTILNLEFYDGGDNVFICENGKE